MKKRHRRKLLCNVRADDAPHKSRHKIRNPAEISARGESEIFARISYIVIDLNFQLGFRAEFFFGSDKTNKLGADKSAVKIAVKVEYVKFGAQDCCLTDRRRNADIGDGGIADAVIFDRSQIYAVFERTPAVGRNVSGWETQKMSEPAPVGNNAAQKRQGSIHKKIHRAFKKN